MPTICLNMIVKNESRIITRLFDSVLPVIDTYCICDTGSTDNTPEIIREYFSDKNIPGEIVHKNFVNFGENRTFAAQCAYNMADYLLFLDADMVLKTSSEFDKNSLSELVYSFSQGDEAFSYDNIRLVHTSIKPTYSGVTHEYISTSHHKKTHINSLFIHDIGDGGCKTDKFQRDMRLLEQGIEEDSENTTRYTFYLANTYRDLGKYEKAIDTYKRRIDMGEWHEEVYVSMYYMGLCYKELNMMEMFVNSMLNAWEYRPVRVEPLYTLIKYYCDTDKHHLAKMLYITAKDIKIPSDSLFVNLHMYGESLCNLHTLFSYYCGDIKGVHKSFKSLFNGNKFSYNYCMKNYKFYKPLIESEKTIGIGCVHNIDLDGVMTEYYGSTPSMILDDCTGDYIVNVRLVSYKIADNGSYIFKDVVSTRNKYLRLDRDFNVKTSQILTDNTISATPLDWTDKLHGIEDIKLYKYKGETYFTGTSLHSDKNIGCVYGKYSLDCLKPTEMKRISTCEKNWVPVPGDKNRFIYRWYPLTICELLEDNTLAVLNTYDMPKLFKNARGSSPGYMYNNEIWYVIHYVYVENCLRTYYHSVVIFDKDFTIKRYSLPFKFSNHRIEYCLGIIVENDRILFSHSENDSNSKISVVSKRDFFNTY